MNNMSMFVIFIVSTSLFNAIANRVDNIAISITSRLICNLIMGFVVARKAEEKGRRFAPWFFFGFVIPLVAMIAILLVSDKNSPKSSTVSFKPAEVADNEEKRAEVTKNITLNEGYQFAKVPSRIFSEKIEEPGRYYCPYCYKMVSSEFASSCSNCGKYLAF